MRRLFILTSLVLLLLIACEKDNNDVPNNHFMINETEYELTKGVIESFGYTNENTTNIDLTLVSDDVVFHKSNGAIDSISGHGHGLYFQMYTSSNDALMSGKYIFTQNNLGELATFDVGVVVFGNGLADSFTGKYNVTSGNVSVEMGKNDYEISIDCVLDNNQKLTAFFKGSLVLHSYPHGKSSRRAVK